MGMRRDARFRAEYPHCLDVRGYRQRIDGGAESHLTACSE